MELFGRDVSLEMLGEAVKARLELGGPSPDAEVEDPLDLPEDVVEPHRFNYAVLAEHVDAARPLPVDTHRPGLEGALVVLAKQAFRVVGQLLIDEVLSRQKVFNGHVRDSYAQLSAEVDQLKARLVSLEAEKVALAAQLVALQHAASRPALAAGEPQPAAVARARPAPPARSGIRRRRPSPTTK